MTTTFIADQMEARGYTVQRGPHVPIVNGAADSRLVVLGSLFAAFHGENTDGNLYVGEAFERGAVAAICERAPFDVPPRATLVVAPSTVDAVGQLATAWRERCKPRVVGITGTVGKTTAKDMTAAVLASRFSTHKSEGNLNSREGMPLAMVTLRPDHEVSVLEFAMDREGEIRELCAIAEPEVGVVLNVGLTHVSKLGSIEAIAREKLSLAKYLPQSGTAVLNADDPRIAPAVTRLRCSVISFGESEAATLRRGPIADEGLRGTRFSVSYQAETAEVHSPLPGAHVVPAALAAMGAGIALGLRLAEAAEAVGAARLEGRLHVLAGPNGSTILDDRYNSSPASLAGTLQMLGGLPGRRIALLGHMAELGEHAVAEHEAAGRVAATTCEILVTAGDLAKVIAQTARAAGHRDVHAFDTKEEAAEAVRGLLREGDYVLVKASRGQSFETIVPMLEGRQ